MRRTKLLATVLLGLCAAMPAAISPQPARAQATRYADAPPIAFGVAWYPEHWPEERWDTDLALMKAAGFNTVRIAEFAWSRMEPQEGAFEFEWLDRAIAAARRHGMWVVLGTPTAAPPAWMTHDYPDTLRVAEDGQRARHGGRRHFSFTSPRYREFARRIAGEMAERYGNHPGVVGWQIDNEVGPPSFDESAVAAWHAFLHERYGSIDTLNERWTTQYWSQRYNNFEQIPLVSSGQHNPGLLLEYRHFVTDVWTDYVRNQVEAIRQHADPRQLITTNSMHWNAGYDHTKLHEAVDFASWDAYVPDGRPVWINLAGNHDLVHGYKQRNFWLMETQPGRTDWVELNRALDPGQVRELAWQAVAHGADAVLYWQWRSALGGQEQYFGTLLGPDGTPAPIYQEVQQIGREFAEAGPALEGTVPRDQVAMLYSYDSRWAIDYQRHNNAFDPLEQFQSYYAPLRRQSQGVAILSPDQDFSRYPLVVAPALNVVTQEQAQRLAEYVRAGGHLVLGPRSGMKDDANMMWPQKQPGPLSDLVGAQVEQFYALDEKVPLAGGIGAGEAEIWAEVLEPQAEDVEVLQRYAAPDSWLGTSAAAVTRKVGRGTVTYLGAWLEPELLERFVGQALANAGVTPILPGTPEGVEVSERTGEGKRLLVLINHGEEAATIAVPAGARSVVGELSGGTLPGHGVAVLQLPD